VDAAIRRQAAAVTDRSHAGDAAADAEDVALAAEGGASMDSRVEVDADAHVCETAPCSDAWVAVRGKATTTIACAHSWDTAAHPEDADALAHAVVAGRAVATMLKVVAVAPDACDEAAARVTRAEASTATTEAVSIEGAASAVSAITAAT
jgi:hypothetical protein